MTPDPMKQRIGRMGGLATAGKRRVHVNGGDPDPSELLRRARKLVPDVGGLSTYDAERITAYATLAIAEMLAQEAASPPSQETVKDHPA